MLVPRAGLRVVTWTDPKAVGPLTEIGTQHRMTADENFEENRAAVCAHRITSMGPPHDFDPHPRLGRAKNFGAFVFAHCALHHHSPPIVGLVRAWPSDGDRVLRKFSRDLQQGSPLPFGEARHVGPRALRREASRLGAQYRAR